MPTSPLVRALAPNAVRITHFDPSAGQPIDRPWQKDVLLDLPENEMRGNSITVKVQGGKCSIFNQQEQRFFSEESVPQMGIHKRKPYFYGDIPQTAFYAGWRKIDNGVKLTLNVSEGESFYGWGEWFNAFERKTGTVTLNNRNALFGEQDRLTYSGLPFFISSKGYGFLLLNSHRSRWDISPVRLEIEADGPGADYILIYGPTYKEILRTYTALTGRPPLLPRWGFGLWVTSYPQEEQKTVLDLIDKHRSKQIPLDALILDYHWEERFHNFKWRKSLIPNPESLATAMKDRGTRLGLILTSYLNTRNRPLQKWLLNTFGQNVTPGVENDDERALDEFRETRDGGYLAHENVRWWFGTGGMLDFTNPAAAAWWQNKLRKLFIDGADFIKNDDGEDLPDDAQAFNGMDGREYHNIYGFYYGRATYHANPCQKTPSAEQTDAGDELRNVIYARTAWVGSQRYPALFLGDQQADFESIRRSLRAGLNLAMSGFSYWTADVFGLAGKTTPEVHMRYAQWALLSPVARYFVRPPRIDNTRFPWSHSQEVEDNFRKYAQLRMRLLPYFNSLAHESYLTGVPLMRPLMFEFEDDERLRGVDDQIMLGNGLMICPVTHPGARKRTIILPKGEWHDFWTEKSWAGNTTIEYPAPLQCMPILVKGGSILPLGPVIQNISDQHNFKQLELHIQPPFPSEGIFFDDDGRTCAYQSGAFSRTRIRAEQTGKQLAIRISAAQGTFPEQLTSRDVELIIHHAKPVISATANQLAIQVTHTDGVVRLSFKHIVQSDTLIQITFEN